MMESQPVNTVKLRWQFYSKQLPNPIIDLWNNNICNAQNAVASSYFCFNNNTQMLMQSTTPTYAVAFIDDATVQSDIEQIEQIESQEATPQPTLSDDSLVAVIPFRKSQRSLFGMTFNLLENMHHKHLDVWYPFIAERFNADDIFVDFFSALRSEVKNWDYFFAEKVMLRNKTNLLCIDDTYQRFAAYFCLKTVNDISQLVSKKLLKNINRLERRLCKELDGKSLQLKIFNQPDAINEALGIFMQLESSGWKGNVGSAIGQSSQLTQFYQANWNEFSKNDSAEIILLMSDEEPVGASIAFRQANKRYLHKVAYDDKHASNGAGAILIRHILEDSIRNPDITEICFNTNPNWLDRWHPEKHSLFAIREFNGSLKGNLLKRYFQVIRLLKLIKRRLVKLKSTKKK
ncbi:GNAT family N-acetyltransferase [Aliikangiella coralliicola]|uniref:GNAT family N-acetyltransferase n=1 Tax=Aliikangiella coralliicola TaxID=2592383 RepID=A0A545UHF9_9GAMM|nr:GNAT family N-acetyltransferase [Aliikangiella coralliicola]TQV88907.1 GNAT family N-acetyltransferase [Aliikangiella coralliicola]